MHYRKNIPISKSYGFMLFYNRDIQSDAWVSIPSTDVQDQPSFDLKFILATNWFI